jgi:hypothetical protein
VVAAQVVPWNGNALDMVTDSPLPASSPQVAQGGAPNANAAVKDSTKKETIIRKGLHDTHANAVQIFSQAPGFGLTRMIVLRKKVEEEVVILSPGELDTNSPLAQEPLLIKANKGFTEFFAEAEPQLFDDRLRGNLFLPVNNGKSDNKAGDTDKTKPAANELWQIETLNLVGLLDAKKPVVYDSFKVRNEWIKMHVEGINKDGVTVKTNDTPAAKSDKNGLPAGARLPNMFEEAAIQKLLQGQSLFVYGQEDTIRMMGALHAGNQCIRCHDVKEGDVLGALSYTLRKAKR